MIKIPAFLDDSEFFLFEYLEKNKRIETKDENITLMKGKDSGSKFIEFDSVIPDVFKAFSYNVREIQKYKFLEVYFSKGLFIIEFVGLGAECEYYGG